MSPILREFVPRDTEGVITAIKHVYDEYGFPWEEDGYHADLYDIQNSYDDFWVAELEGEIIGCIGLNLFETLPGELGTVQMIGKKIRVCQADCELNRLYLMKQSRGYGLGRKLSQICIDRAKEHGCKNMEIWTDKIFYEAHGLYQSLGAEIIGERLCNDPTEAPEWGMLLILSN